MNGLFVGRGTALFGVVGYPLTHTLSPPMQNAAFRALDMSAAYVPVPLVPSRLRTGLSQLADAGAAGLNVTVPFKRAVLDWVDETHASAARAGSANTITWRGGRSIAGSTDGAGLVADLATWGVTPSGLRVAMIGAGGAARAAAIALIDGGAHVTCYARDPDRASREIPWEVASLDRLARTGRIETDLVVHATPLGADGRSAVPVAWDAIDPGARVYDMVYEPRETPLLAAARRAGHMVRGGVGMLVQQGARAFEAWTDRRAPVRVMAEAIGARDVVA